MNIEWLEVGEINFAYIKGLILSIVFENNNYYLVCHTLNLTRSPLNTNDLESAKLQALTKVAEKLERRIQVDTTILKEITGPAYCQYGIKTHGCRGREGPWCNYCKSENLTS